MGDSISRWSLSRSVPVVANTLPKENSVNIAGHRSLEHSPVCRIPDNHLPKPCQSLHRQRKEHQQPKLFS